MVLSCGVRARKALFYKVFAGSYFLYEGVKNRHFKRKWCSKWCGGIVMGDVERYKIADNVYDDNHIFSCCGKKVLLFSREALNICFCVLHIVPNTNNCLLDVCQNWLYVNLNRKY